MNTAYCLLPTVHCPLSTVTMASFNGILTDASELLLSPLARWPLLALAVFSAIAGVLMAIVFRFTSNQQAIRRAADGCRAELLAIKLFQDDLLGVWKSLGRLFGHMLRRLGHSLVPMFVLIIPFFLVLVQLALRFEARPLVPGQSAIVQLQSRPAAWRALQHAQLQQTPHVQVTAGPIRDVSEYTVTWRIRIDDEAETTSATLQLPWKIGNVIVEKRLDVAHEAESLTPVSLRRANGSWWDQLFHPSEPGLPAATGIAGIEILYPPRSTPIAGWDVPWWLTFLVISMLAAIIVRPWVGVEF